MTSTHISEKAVVNSILEQKNIDSSVLDRLYEEYADYPYDSSILEKIASHERTSSSLLKIIANRSETTPRKAALLNPNLNYEVALQIIIDRRSWGLIKYIAERNHVPSEAVSACVNKMISSRGLKNLYYDEIATIPKLSPKLIELIINEGKITTYVRLLNQEHITSELIERIWEEYNQASMNGHPDMSKDYANVLAERTIGHRNFPVHILMDLKQSGKIEEKLFYVLPNIQERVYKYLQEKYDTSITNQIPWSWVQELIENGLPEEQINPSQMR